MTLFCKHKWTVVKVTYAPPTSNIKSINRLIDLHEFGILQGLTTVLYECTKCKDIKKVEMLGESKDES